MIRRSLLLVALSLLLLLLHSTLALFVSQPALTPMLLLPLVISLGVMPEVPVIRGALIAFVLGYLVDGFSGCPMGLQTFIFVATFVLARLVGLRLFMRGATFQLSLSAGLALAAGIGIVTLRSVFEGPQSLTVGIWETRPSVNWWALLGSSLATAVLAPALFRLVRRIESIGTERAA